MRRCFLYIGIGLLFLSGCCLKGSCCVSNQGCCDTEGAEAFVQLKMNFNDRPFSVVHTNGYTVLEIEDRACDYELSLPDLTNNECGYKYRIDDGVLYLYSQCKCETGKLKLRVPKVTTIVADEYSKITAKNFRANNLTIIAKHHGSIDIDSPGVNVKRIEQRSIGKIQLNWLDNLDDALTIIATGSGKIILGGDVERFFGVFINHAWFQGQFLRTQEALVKTYDHALVKVKVQDKLVAQAYNFSTIKYYGSQPKILIPTSRQKANILFASCQKVPAYLNKLCKTRSPILPVAIQTTEAERERADYLERMTNRRYEKIAEVPQLSKDELYLERMATRRGGGTSCNGSECQLAQPPRKRVTSTDKIRDKLPAEVSQIRVIEGKSYHHDCGKIELKKEVKAEIKHEEF